jgi:hypothetical protein
VLHGLGEGGGQWQSLGEILNCAPGCHDTRVENIVLHRRIGTHRHTGEGVRNLHRQVPGGVPRRPCQVLHLKQLIDVWVLQLDRQHELVGQFIDHLEKRIHLIERLAGQAATARRLRLRHRRSRFLMHRDQLLVRSIELADEVVALREIEALEHSDRVA